MHSIRPLGLCAADFLPTSRICAERQAGGVFSRANMTVRSQCTLSRLRNDYSLVGAPSPSLSSCKLTQNSIVHIFISWDHIIDVRSVTIFIRGHAASTIEPKLMLSPILSARIQVMSIFFLADLAGFPGWLFRSLCWLLYPTSVVLSSRHISSENLRLTAICLYCSGLVHKTLFKYLTI